MVQRRLLTKEYIATLTSPEKGETWIADTQVRGFGIRLWPKGMAYAIRTTDVSGYSIRRTYDLRQHMNSLDHWRLYDELDEQDETPKLENYLTSARDWAFEEIAHIKAKPIFAKTETQAEIEYELMRDGFGQYLLSVKLDTLINSILQLDKDRGWEFRRWTQEYWDRLWRAFNQFDPDDIVRNQTISQLKDGVLADAISNSMLSHNNLRLLTTLLNLVATNLRNIGDIGIDGISGYDPLDVKSTFEENSHELEHIQIEDFKLLFKRLEELDGDWRTKTCIRMCFELWAPISAVKQGKWSSIIDGIWYPYPQDNLQWRGRSRILHTEFIHLKQIRRQAHKEAIRSDFWFPSSLTSDAPIQNLDRTWKHLIADTNWSNLTLSKAVKHYRNIRPFRAGWSDKEELREIEIEINRWNAE